MEWQMTSPHELLNPDELAAPRGFSHAVVAQAGKSVYLAGQTALAADGKIVGETIAEQFDKAASNLLAALAGAGGRAEDIVSLQIFVADVEEYKERLAEVGR